MYFHVTFRLLFFDDPAFIFLHMMRLFRVQLAMLVFISLLGGVLIYELFDQFSGLDAIGMAGMLTGFFIGLCSGKNLGMFSLYPSMLSALSGSVIFIILAYLSMNSNDSIMLVFGQCAIGFCLLAGTVSGCQWGGHLFIREQDLIKLKEIFGEDKYRKPPPTDTEYSQDD
jgi:hypothetical protein